MKPPATVDPRGEPVISIVIVHYRTPDILAKCLARIAEVQIDLSYEIIIVDNAPLDTSARELAAKHRADYLHNKRNVGYGRAVNQGMASARGGYFLILNPDVAIGPGSVEVLRDYMEAHRAAGLCGPKLYSPDGSLQYSARTFYTLRIILLRRTPLGKLFPHAKALREHLMMDWDHNDAREVDWMLGGAVLVRREVIRDVGGMDERFFLYFEDVDWCSRMHGHGWRVVYVPQAEMVHTHQRASARGFLSSGKRVHLESALRFYEKWSLVLYLWKKKTTQIRAITTLLADVVFLSVAFLAAYVTRYYLGIWIQGWSAVKPVLRLEVYARVIGFTDLVAIGSFYFLGLYKGEVWRDRWREYFQLVKGVAITSLVVMASTFLFTTRPLSRFTIVLLFPYALIFIALGRELLRRMVAEARERKLHMRRLAVFASSESIEKLKERLRRHGSFGYEPIYLPHDDERRHPWEGALDPVERRIRFLENERIAEVAVFESPGESELLERLMPRLLATGIPVKYVPREELLLLEARQLCDFMGFGAVSLGGRPQMVGSWVKRACDLALASGLLFLGFPLHLIQLLVLGSPAVIARRVVGRGGKSFGMRRYREETALVARISALRFYPSLVSVLAGEMSFVGISSLTPEQWAGAEEAYCLNPPDAPVGLLAEFAGEHAGAADGEDIEQILIRNRRYVKAWSLSEDLRVLLQAAQGRKGKEGDKV